MSPVKTSPQDFHPRPVDLTSVSASVSASAFSSAFAADFAAVAALATADSIGAAGAAERYTGQQGLLFMLDTFGAFGLALTPQPAAQACS